MTHVLSKQTERLLRLSFLPGIGVAALRKLVEHGRRAGLPEDDRAALALLAKTPVGRGKQNVDGWKQIIEDCQELGLQIISALDDDYPLALRHIDDFPPIIYLKGNRGTLGHIGCAVVGTREASHLGVSWAKQIAEVFASNNYCVISGLALGIDSAAHQGALRAKGPTIAVLAHGLDQITPASNKPLASAILEAGGALISEHPPRVPPRRAEYVRRNRIQSGMSVCSVVVESGESGGAIHQGNFTCQQRRRLYCVVPSKSVRGAGEFRYGGAQRLMKEACAVPIHSRNELLNLIAARSLDQDFSRFQSSPSFYGPTKPAQGALFDDSPRPRGRSRRHAS